MEKGVELTEAGQRGDPRTDGVTNPSYTPDTGEEALSTDVVEILVKPNVEVVENGLYDSLQGLSTKDTVRRRRRGFNPVGLMQQTVKAGVERHKDPIAIVIKLLLLALYFLYFGYAMAHRFGDEGSLRLLVLTCFGFLLVLYKCLKGVLGLTCICCPARCLLTSAISTKRLRTLIRWFLYVGAVGFVVLYTALDIGRNNPRNLMSLAGIATFILLLYITSADASQVNWHPVFWGLVVQYVFALLIIRTTWGYEAFNYLGDRVTEMLDYSNKGAAFVFGDKYTDHIFAMKALPVIVYFSALISVLYYLGVMQAVISVAGRFLAFCLQTSPTESLSAAGNIFIGQTEAPLLIRPFMEKLTRSELHAVMTGGFATVSGSVLGTYILFGVRASYLLGASVMAAPCSLAMSKLAFPETEENGIDEKEVYKIAAGTANNIIEAASAGASSSIKLVANVAVNVMAFLAILELLNATLVWLGDRVGVDGLSFQFLCSYLFYPLTYLMGVDEADCRRVAQLIGYKVFTNEFVAYVQMGELLKNGHRYMEYTDAFGQNATIVQHGLDIVLPQWNNTVLAGGFLSARSEVIATYSLCGFANLGSMGIQLGGLGAMAPSRRTDLSHLVLRAMITGCVVCFTTACIAGLFFDQN